DPQAATRQSVGAGISGRNAVPVGECQPFAQETGTHPRQPALYSYAAGCRLRVPPPIVNIGARTQVPHKFASCLPNAAAVFSESLAYLSLCCSYCSLGYRLFWAS